MGSGPALNKAHKVSLSPVFLASLCKFSITLTLSEGSHRASLAPSAEAWAVTLGCQTWVTRGCCHRGCRYPSLSCPAGALLQLPPPTHFRTLHPGYWLCWRGRNGYRAQHHRDQVTWVKKSNSCIHCTIFSDLFKTAQMGSNVGAIFSPDLSNYSILYYSTRQLFYFDFFILFNM